MDKDDDNCNCDEGIPTNKQRPHFHVLTNPLEMERFFNQQIDDIFKVFGIFGPNTDEDRGAHPFPGFQGFSSIREPEKFLGSDEKFDDKGSRDFMLKEESKKKEIHERPGYIEPGADYFRFSNNLKEKGEKTDLDLDERGINSAELDKLYENPHDSESRNSRPPPFDGWSHRPGTLFGGLFGRGFPFSDPFLHQQRPKEDNDNWTTHSFSFGQSSSQSTVRLPDGATEEQSETSDSQGNKVNKTTKRTRDGEWYRRTCVTKPGGIEECHEESSSGFHAVQDGNNEEASDGTIKGFGSYFDSFRHDSQSNPSSGKGYRDDMMKREENTYGTLFETFFGKR